jgi:hypothetical protein
VHQDFCARPWRKTVQECAALWHRSMSKIVIPPWQVRSQSAACAFACNATHARADPCSAARLSLNARVWPVWQEEHLDSALQREADAQALCYASQDLAEGERGALFSRCCAALG